MIYESIAELVCYGVRRKFIKEEDRIYTTNKILELLQLDEYESTEPDGEENKISLEKVLREITDYALDNKIIEEDSVVYRDLFDTKLMGQLIPKPSEVIHNFWDKYKISPRNATDYFYQFAQDSNYIRNYRIKKDLKWKVKTEYGDLDLTINLSKPEKDPRAIAAAKMVKQGGYPKCLLCRENEGYAGRVNHPARQNHRIIPITIDKEQWGFQYSPYVYYNEHCIVLNGQHVPMKIEKKTFSRLFDFIKLFPHYFLGSNADLPIVGGSILTHDHFQGGNYTFPMAKAEIEEEIPVKGFEDVRLGIVKWPMSVVRLCCRDEKRLSELGDRILTKWRQYTDENAFIYAQTDGEPHNTITPIARKNEENYELDIVLRNNITTKEHPLGVFHPHSELHHIKKENIGLIEVMGLAVLPARLKEEIEVLKTAVLEGRDLNKDERTQKHAAWAGQWKKKYTKIGEENIDKIIENEIGCVFKQVLEQAGVFKRTEDGQAAFKRFLLSL